MLYLDLMNQDGGQLYLDIRSVEAFGRGTRAGIVLQGVLGDGYREVQIMVEQVAGEVSLVFLEHQVPFVIANGAGSEFPDQLRAELQRELLQIGLTNQSFKEPACLDVAF